MENFVILQYNIFKIKLDSILGGSIMDIRYAVRVFAFKDNKVACIKYKNINKDYFDIPGGKIEDGETEIQTCIREFKEETGMDINDLKCIGNVEIIYPGKNKKICYENIYRK